MRSPTGQTTRSPNTTTRAVLTGLALAGALASCGSPAAEAPVAHQDYADGTYTGSGQYQAPSGTESVEVTITLADNTVTEVEVIGDASDPQARLHQGQFISGIGAIVEGKNIDELQVDRVGGSSLTSGGFNRALEAIKAEAAQ